MDRERRAKIGTSFLYLSTGMATAFCVGYALLAAGSMFAPVSLWEYVALSGSVTLLLAALMCFFSRRAGAILALCRDNRRLVALCSGHFWHRQDVCYRPADQSCCYDPIFPQLTPVDSAAAHWNVAPGKDDRTPEEHWPIWKAVCSRIRQLWQRATKPRHNRVGESCHYEGQTPRT